jgi:hypothetical protein
MFWLEILKEIDYFEDPGMQRKIILKFVFKKRWSEDVDWIQLAYDKIW